MTPSVSQVFESWIYDMWCTQVFRRAVHSHRGHGFPKKLDLVLFVHVEWISSWLFLIMFCTANLQVLLCCLCLRHYTVRYRERNRKWNYQTCPTSETVIDNLKPNAVYEFGVQPTSKDGPGDWSKPVIHNISNGVVQRMFISFYNILSPSPHWGCNATRKTNK